MKTNIKLTYNQIQVIGISIISAIVLLLFAGIVIFSFFLKNELLKHNQLMNTNAKISKATQGIISSGYLFFYEISNGAAGNPKLALESLQYHETLSDILPEYYEYINQFNKISLKLATVYSYYLSKSQSGDPTMDLAKETMNKTAEIIADSISVTNSVLSKIEASVNNQSIKQFNTIVFFRNSILLLALLALICILLFGILLKVILKRKLDKISTSAIKIGEGKFDVKLEETGRDSVSLLAQTINKMSAKIQELLAKQTELTKIADDHFKEAQQKTAELEKEIKKRESAENIISYQATHDSLTGLANRAHFDEMLITAVSRAKRFNEEFTLIMFDLDHFKYVNDTFGHDVGDILLQKVAKIVIQQLRKEDFFARMGGDEFVIILNKTSGVSEGGIIAKKIMHSLSVEDILIDGHKTPVAASLGIAIFPHSGTTAEQIYKSADIAMYHAKEAGRNNYQYFTQEFNAQFKRHLDVETSIRSAIEKQELFLLYQPIFDLRSRKIMGVETLMRWKTSDDGLIEPEEFIPVAESMGYMDKIGTWLFESVAKQIDAWLSEGIRGLYITINLSPYQLENKEFIKILSNVLKSREGTDNSMPVKLEISEHAVITHIDRIEDSLQKIKDLEYKIWIDNFKLGLASLKQLEDLPISTLKIDKSFVENIPEKQKYVKIIQTIIALAESLELEIIAEGIETQAQMDMLIKLGCKFGQGYYLCKPASPDDIAKLYQQLSS